MNGSIPGWLSAARLVAQWDRAGLCLANVWYLCFLPFCTLLCSKSAKKLLHLSTRMVTDLCTCNDTQVTKCHQISGGCAGCHFPQEAGGTHSNPFHPPKLCPLREGEPPSPVLPSSSHWGSRTPLPRMDATGWGSPCRAGVGAPSGSQQHLLPLALVRAAGHWFPVGTPIEPCWDSPPSLWGGLSSGTDPTLFWVARERLFPAARGAGAASALPGTGDAKQGPHWLQSNQLAMGSCDRRSPCPFSLAAEVKRNYFSHLGWVLGEQIPAQLRLSCQFGLAPLAEG